MQLFPVNTITQYHIMEWLRDQGIAAEDIVHSEWISRDTVKLTNPAGQYLVAGPRDGSVQFL